MVARHEQRHQLAILVGADERLDRGRLGDLQEVRQLGDGMHARRGDLLHGVHLVLRGLRHARRSLRIGCEVAFRAGDQLGFAGICKRHVLHADLAADLAGVRIDRAVLQAAALADVPVGLAHLVVHFLQRLL